MLLGIELTEEEKEEHQSAWGKAFDDVQTKQVQKIMLLAERYGIKIKSETSLLFVLLRLAEETVPGFRIDFGGTRPGRRQVWTHSRYAELLADVEAEKR